MKRALFAAALLSVAGNARAGEDFEEHRLGERHALAMLVVRAGASKSAPGTDLFRAADEALSERTGLTIETPEDAGIDAAVLAACPADELLACYARAVPSTSQHSRLQHLLVVTLFERSDGKTNLSSLMIDLAAARRAMESIFGGDEDAKQRLEDAIFERTARAKERVVDLKDAAAVSAYFRGLAEQDLRAMIEASGEYEPFGELELDGVPAALELAVDDSVIGRTAGKAIIIREVRPRKLRIELSDPQRRFLPLEREVDVVRGERAKLDVQLVPAADPGAAPAIRRATFWSGVGLSTIGTVLLISTLAAAPSAERVTPCAGGDCSPQGARFASFCELTKDRPSACGSGGVLPAPLGYSMAATGAVWAFSTAFFGDENDAPWWALISGAVLGIASYSISALAN